MLHRIREQVGSAGLIVAIIALVAALAGSALAVNGSGSGDGKNATASAKKGPRGPRGKPGKPGPAGPQGPQGLPGAAGAKGDPGAKGDQGSEGKQGPAGTNGKSLAMKAAGVADCENEVSGVIIEEVGNPASAEAICDGQEGEQGEQGEEGKPWTPDNTLPADATLTGMWALNGTAADTAGVIVPISFQIPLPAGLGEEDVHFITALEFIEESPESLLCGGVAPNPKAPSGSLCVYESFGNPIQNAVFEGIFESSNESNGTASSGALLRFKELSGVAKGSGTWAVTG